jgi:outer membrane protein assembly factor BamB
VLQTSLALAQDADTPLARIKSQIFRIGLKTQAEGASILSTKGRPQNWLIDMRRLFLHRDTLELIAREFWARFDQHQPFQIAGMETAAIPLLTALMIYAPRDRGVVNAVIIRKERKITGLCNPIEGELTDLPIVLVDDILNSGGSAEKARAVIAQAGRRFWKAFVVVDYQSQRGLRWREEKGVDVTALFVLVDLNLELAKAPSPPTQHYKDLWRTEVSGGFPFNVVPKSPPVLLGNVIYRGCDAGKLHAFDALTGKVVWEFAVKGTGRKGIMSAPLLHEGRVYFGAFNGAIYCLDAASGIEIWSQSYGEWVGASPIVAPKHGLVYFGIEYARPWARGSIGAFALDTGARVWEHLVHKLQHGSPAYWHGGDLILWGSADHEMVALKAGTGDVVWVFPTRRSVKYAPAIDEERGYCAFASFDTSIYVLDVRNGKKLGEWPTGEICYTTPLIHQSRLFCGSGDRHFYVIDLDRMELIKKMDMGGRVYASPKLIGGRVVFATCGGVVIEMDPQTLEITGRLQLPDAVTNAVAASDDGRRIFISTYMNHLYAFERLEMAPPMSLQDLRTGHPTAPVPPPLVSFRRLAVCEEVDVLRQEILAQPELWKASTVRQNTIAVQRETESIFLRAAQRKPDSPIAVEDTHLSARTLLAERFPKTMGWVEAFAREQGARLSRVLLAKLQPQGQVYRHHDHGEYYRIRDRYHLVLWSPQGSPMVCGDETVVMRPGEVWWFDNKKPHEAFNRSDEDRIHLIFDLLPGIPTANEHADSSRFS